MGEGVRRTIDRLVLAIEGTTFADLARFLDVSPPAINAALRKKQIPELWLYKVAEKTGRRVEWLRTGHGPELESAVLQELLDRVKNLKVPPADIGKPNREMGELSAAVREMEGIVRIAEQVTAYPLTPAPALSPGLDASGLDDEERATVQRLVDALKAGDPQIRSHLIGQLRLIDELVQAKRSARPPRAKTASD